MVMLRCVVMLVAVVVVFFLVFAPSRYLHIAGLDHSIRLHMNYAVQDEHLMCLTHEATLFESLRAQYICSSVYF